MNGEHGDDTERVRALRQAFDETFARPPRAGVTDLEDLLGIQVGGDPYAVRLGEIAGLFVDKRIVPLPSTMPGLLGVAGIRGGVVPVYGLYALLGYPTPATPPRWFVLTGERVGLGFGDLDGYLRITSADVAQVPSESAERHVRETVRVGGTQRAILSIPSVVETIKKRLAAGGPQKDR
ncbi:MAG TPA: chemotaxis protein CheW [Polyangiaceae bacterium]